jgi:hypothetical protein
MINSLKSFSGDYSPATSGLTMLRGGTCPARDVRWRTSPPSKRWLPVYAAGSLSGEILHQCARNQKVFGFMREFSEAFRVIKCKAKTW